MENRRVFHSWTCQTPDKARAYIRLDAEVDGSGVTAVSRLCPAGERTLPSSAELLDDLNAETAAWLDTPVGHLDTALEPDTPLNMAKNGSLIANFFNQVQLEASGADISATCLGNEVKGFDRDVTIRDVVATYIYPNTLKTLEVDRAVLKAALERCASYFDFDESGALCVSESFLKPKVEHYNFDFFAGLEVRMELRRPVGERVSSIRFQGEELPEGRKLRLCLNNYRATGTGGYPAYADCPVVRDQPTEIVEMIMDYIKAHGEIRVDKTRWYTVLT
jgi:2',3'-cyclic-nucleotide 2'-phosphodiesterase/3'-nucleotidase